MKTMNKKYAIITILSLAACPLVFTGWPAINVILGTILVAIVLLAIFLIFKAESAKNKEIAVVAILSLFMMLALPIGNVPDEPAHLQRIYSISTGQVFPSSGFAEMPENLVNEIGPYTTIFGLKDITDKVLGDDTTELGVSFATGIYPIINYLPQTIMMTIARLVTDNRVFILYSARLGSWLASMIMLYFAFKMLPYGKKELMLISILPICLQGLAGASADGMAFSAVSLLVSYVLYIRETKQLANIPALVVLAILVVNLKFMYFPMIFLMTTIPKESFRIRKRIILPIIFLCALASVAIWAGVCYLFFSTGTQVNSSPDTINKVVYMIIHPMKFGVKTICTLYEGLILYFSQLFGGALGYYNIYINQPINTLLMAGMVVIVINDMKNVSDMRLFRQLCIEVAACVIVISVMLWIDYTPIESERIWGIQGRYFLPLLFPMCVCVCVWNKKELLPYRKDLCIDVR